MKRFLSKELTDGWKETAERAIKNELKIPQSTMSVIEYNGREYMIVLEVTPK